MNYKKIFKARATRQRILRSLSFVPDRPMLRIQYLIKTGRILHLKNPKRFTEKIQWYKLNYRNSLMISCVDKYDVREYVRKLGLEGILVHCYGVYEVETDIPWNDLPGQFVMKDSLGGGGNSVVIVQNKEDENIERLQVKARQWLTKRTDKKGSGREWPYYSGKKHRILIEELLIDPIHKEEGINDYKIYCFNGNPFCINVDFARFGNHRRNYYDVNWNRLDVESNYPNYDGEFPKPQNFEKMLSIASKLSKAFPFARIDLYNIQGIIYFSEITFFPASGYMWYKPDQFDYSLGEKFGLKKYEEYTSSKN